MQVGPGTGKAVTFLRIDNMVFPADIRNIRSVEFPNEDILWVFKMDDGSQIFATGPVCCMIHDVEEE